MKKLHLYTDDTDTFAAYSLNHLDGRKDNNAWWNLAALCQACHLHIQSKVHMERIWMFKHSEWFKLYVAGYYAYHYDLPDDIDFCARYTDDLILVGQGRKSVNQLISECNL